MLGFLAEFWCRWVDGSNQLVVDEMERAAGCVAPAMNGGMHASMRRAASISPQESDRRAVRSRYGDTSGWCSKPWVSAVRLDRSGPRPLNSAPNTTQQIENASHISHARRPRRRRRQRRLRAAPSAAPPTRAAAAPRPIVVHLIFPDDGAAPRRGKGRGAGVPRGAV